jgi:hypothetical protein
VAHPANSPRPSPGLHPSRDAWTVDDVLELPEGNKYEILDGGLFVSPMAVVHLHQNGPGGFILEHTVKTDERYVETVPFEVVLEPATWMR